MTSNTFGNAPPDPSTRSPAWLWPFAPMAVAAVSLSALVFYHLRHDGFEVRSALQHAYAGVYRTFGFAPSVMFFGLVVLWSTIWLVHGRLDRPLQRLGRLAAMAVLLGVLLNLGDGGVAPALHKGALGAWLAGAMVAAVGYWPTLVVVWGFTFASLLLATDFFFHESFERMLAAGAPERASATPVVGSATPVSAAAVEAPAPVAPADADPAADEGQARRRRSYYERRAERVAAAARWSEPAASDEAAPVDEPSAPVAADPLGEELSAARVVAAIDAAEGADGAAIAPEEAEALDRGAGAEPGDAAAAAAVGATVGAPIVFPDEIAADADRAAAARDAAVEWSAAAALGATAGDEPPAAPAEADAGIDSEFADDGAPAAPAAVEATESVDAPPAGDAFSAAAGDGDDQPGADLHAGAPAATAASDDREALAAWLRDAGAWRDAATPVDDAQADAAAPDDAVAEASPASVAGTAPLGEPAADAVAEPVAEPVTPASAAADPIVTIPRPDAAASRPGAPDEAIMREAIDLVVSSRRANAVFLQRKLRIDYDLAAAVLVELAARGIVALDAEATHGRILV